MLAMMHLLIDKQTSRMILQHNYDAEYVEKRLNDIYDDRDFIPIKVMFNYFGVEDEDGLLDHDGVFTMSSQPSPAEMDLKAEGVDPKRDEKMRAKMNCREEKPSPT